MAFLTDDAGVLKEKLKDDVTHLQHSGVSSNHIEHFIDVLEKMPIPARSANLNVSEPIKKEEDSDGEGEGVAMH